jgi:hypothetical protein
LLHRPPLDLAHGHWIPFVTAARRLDPARREFCRDLTQRHRAVLLNLPDDRRDVGGERGGSALVSASARC